MEATGQHNQAVRLTYTTYSTLVTFTDNITSAVVDVDKVTDGSQTKLDGVKEPCNGAQKDWVCTRSAALHVRGTL